MAETALIEPAALRITLPPTQDELPGDDGVPMETERHKLQVVEAEIARLRALLAGRDGSSTQQ
jgi:hypothetical protein